jgi:UDP-N-acetylglucosamine 2-epimerase (non-hydrolysing)
VGSVQERIFREVNMLIEDKAYYQRMVNIINPFGDGTAAEIIIGTLRKSLE